MLANKITLDNLMICKKCGLHKAVKSGVIGGRQRFRCKNCGCNFRFGDKRTNERTIIKKALCILMYSTSNYSYRRLGKLFQTDHTLIYRWIREFGEHLPEPKTSEEIKQLEFDELWHFIGLKNENVETLKQFTTIREDMLDEHLVNAIMQHLDNYTSIK
jgi:transposase